MKCLLSEAIMNSRYRGRLIETQKKIKICPQIRSIFGGTQISMCISKNKPNGALYRIKALRVLMGTAVFKRSSLQIGRFLV